jgi:hypothetical protein
MGWRELLDSATHRNRRILSRAAAYGGGDAAPLLTAAHTARPAELAAAVRELIPYGFDGYEQHKILDLFGCHARGYGACADGAALARAALLVAGERDIALCIETEPTHANYSHVRILWRGVPVEPYPEVRFEVAQCTVVVDAAAARLPTR